MDGNDLIDYIDSDVVIFLKNKLKYSGKVLSVNTGSIKIDDCKEGVIIINLDIVSMMYSLDPEDLEDDEDG